MSDLVSPALKRRRLSTSGRREDGHDTSTSPSSVADDDALVGPAPSHTMDLAHKRVADPTLLHFLDGYYIKRHTIDPWNTSGAFCDVFTGDHPTFGKVAMKRPRMSGDECTASQLRSFISEGELWKGLRHPNVLQFVGIIQSPRYVWLVSVFAEHGTLREFIEKYPKADRHSLVFQFTSGLAYLHSKSVIHGDLKSFNLFISIRGSLLIGDFGLSKFAGMTTAASKKGAGSTNWMAPELLFEEPPTKTLSSDVYAYGITISEILSGNVPFYQYTHQFSLMKAMSNNERPPKTPRESPEGKSYDILWAVAEDCWDPAPSKRPSMIQVCTRFSVDYTRPIEGAIPGGVSGPDQSNRASDLPGLSTADYEAVTEMQSLNLHPLTVNRTTQSSNTTDAHILHLLGDAEYGDTGYMKDDGLCLAGTRVEILERLDRWAEDEWSPRVMLLKGQAGRGKSTIARSVNARCRERWGENGSSAVFHFRRNNEASNHRLLLALAHQLGCSGDPLVKFAILQSIKDHQNVAQLRLEEQFEVLLVQSFKALETSPSRILFVIDALDECSNHSLMAAFLRLIRKHIASFPSTVKFLLTSRPEEHVIHQFNASFGEVRESLDDVDVGLIDRDVRAYITNRLFGIQRDFGLEEAWVSSEAINELVPLSQGLFQWAHAAMEYVRERPRPHLQQLVRSPTGVLGLPALYQQILSTAFPLRNYVNGEDTPPELIQHVVGSLIVSHRPMSSAALDYLWDHDPDTPHLSEPSVGICDSVLGRLGSMFRLPASPEGPIYFMHTSIRDFFINATQCQDRRFLIDPVAHHARLADTCFRRMKRDLRRDICGINDPSKMNFEVLDIVECRIPSGLRYCCHSWSTHLSEAGSGGNASYNKLRGLLDQFCKVQIMHWLEVVSLTGVLSEVFDMLRRATGWVENTKFPQSQAETETITLLHDTYDFCRRFFKPLATNAQHITRSCLLHLSDETSLRNVYGISISQQVPRIKRGPVLHRSDWSSVIPIGSEVSCVAFSPDGRTVASGLDNGKIMLWNTYTGEARGEPLIGHLKRVSCVTFSPDGETLASGSIDTTIQLWSVNSGQRKGKLLVGHSGSVNSVNFSPDGKTLASGSHDSTILLWSVDTGMQKSRPFVGHTDWVRSVAFSPDGTILASGSFDHTVRLWTVNTGEQKGEPLVGHTNWVFSVAFSPDGTILASGSHDNTILLWTVDTGVQKGRPLVGHTDWVRSVAFSFDGTILASGSHDGTILLWTVNRGELKGKPLLGHTDFIFSVAFSPDGTTIASGSDDHTVRLWPVDTGEHKGMPLVGHTGLVRGVALSLDGKILASGSSDNTIRLWNVDTGEQKGQPLVGGLMEVNAVAFSPDGKILASGSADYTIRLWTVETGEQTGKPLDGHKREVDCVAFSPDGKILASGSYDNTVRLWNVDTGEPKGRPLLGYTGGVKSITFSADGRILTSESPTQTFSWRLDRGEPSMEENCPSDSSRPDAMVTLSDAESSDSSERGWVFVRGKRCFWLPEEFYLDRLRNKVQISLCGTLLVLHHPDIHFLDISAFL